MASEIRKVFMKRLFHAALLVLTLLLPAACKAQTAAEDPCVFIGEEIALPDGWHPLAAVCPYAGEHGIAALCSDGEKYALFSYDPDAEEGAWTRTEGDFPKAVSLIGGTVTEDAVFLVSAEEGFGAFTLTRYGTDGAAEKTVSLDTFFGAVDPMRFGIYAVAATDRGVCALSGGEKIVCLDAEMNLSFSVSCGGAALGLAFDSAGDLVALFPGEDCFRQLDGKTGAVKKTISGAARAKKLFRSADGGICFTDSVGVKRFSEKGEHSPMLDYLNSNLTAQTTSVLGVCHEDAVLLLRGGAESRLCLYRRSDEPVSWGSTLEIAVTQESSVLSNAIRVFSARHGDIHITLTDYSQYNTKDDWQAGQKRLALDLTTGVYKPDLIYAPASDIEMQTAIRENFYVDLIPRIVV